MLPIHVVLEIDGAGGSTIIQCDVAPISRLRADGLIQGTSTMSSTVSTITPSESPALLAPPGVHRFTVDEFERIVDSLDDDQVELIDGYIVERDDMKPSHVKALGRVRRRLEPMLPAGWFIREEKPVRIPDFDQPRPDVAVVPGDSDFFGDRHPGPADVALLIEVSDTSLLRDQGAKKIQYGRAGIPVYWIVNINGGQIEVYTNPTADGYASRVDRGPGDNLEVVINGKVVGRIAVDDILP